MDLLIISGKYGLVDPRDKIEFYDNKMNAEQAERLRPDIARRFTRFVKNKQYRQICCVLSRIYYSSISEVLENYCESTQTDLYRINRKTLGEKQHDLKNWIIRNRWHKERLLTDRIDALYNMCLGLYKQNPEMPIREFFVYIADHLKTLDRDIYFNYEHKVSSRFDSPQSGTLDKFIEKEKT